MHPHLEYVPRNVHVPPPLVGSEELGGGWEFGGGMVLGGRIRGRG